MVYQTGASIFTKRTLLLPNISQSLIQNQISRFSLVCPGVVQPFIDGWSDNFMIIPAAPGRPQMIHLLYIELPCSVAVFANWRIWWDIDWIVNNYISSVNDWLQGFLNINKRFSRDCLFVMWKINTTNHTFECAKKQRIKTREVQSSQRIRLKMLGLGQMDHGHLVKEEPQAAVAGWWQRGFELWNMGHFREDSVMGNPRDG